MPQYRKLHTKTVDSYDFAEMPDDFTRLFWMLLILTADSAGRSINNAAWLRSKMYPLRQDVELEQIENAVNWLSERGMITEYEHDGRKYFFINNFTKYQTGLEREARSVLPAPSFIDGNSRVSHELVTSDSGVNQEELLHSVVVVVNESVNESVYGEIFKIYEQNIGPLAPMISDDIQDAVKTYSKEWIEDAIKIAVDANKRKWNYVRGILENWRVDGRKDKRSVEKFTEFEVC